VLTCSLVAALMVAMIFIPFLGYFLLKPKIEPPLAERRKKGFPAFYYRVGQWSINHRWVVFVGSLVLLAGGAMIGSRLKTDFFPKDLSTFHTSTSGCRKTRRCRLQTRQRGVLKK
jgi:multidrug efflux pump subunit AcrB